MKNKYNLTSHKELKARFMKRSGFRHEFEKLKAESQIARQIIEARIKKKISQQELAKKMGTGQAVVSRLEGMNGKPSISLLERVAKALQIKINLTIG